jgi:ABC-2 type transport system permease protein
MWRRILAILAARNREFYRDKAGLGWNIVMPILMVMAFAFIFGGPPEDLFKVGVIRGPAEPPASPFLTIRHVTFVPVAEQAVGVLKVERHQLDLLLDLSGAPGYWVNLNSPRGYLAERLLLGAYAAPPEGETPQRRTVTGEALSYADWVLPGVLAMNVMFSSLWGVGWVVVRYRKNGVLRRLKATPLTPFEFLAAQVLSRLLVVLGASLVVYLGAALFLDFPMRGSYLALALIFASGALCLISLGLIVAARLRTEELADGILNLISWPMLLLSGVWFSMEGTSPAAQTLSQVFPITHMVAAARRVMIDGAGVLEVLPEVGLLAALALALLAVAARLFCWE